MAKKKAKSQTSMVSFRADPALLKRIQDHVRREDRKMADCVRRLVVKALDAEPGR